MKWSLRLGSVFGIPVYVHMTFVVLLGGLGIAQLIQGGPVAAMFTTILIAAVFGCVLLHEFGHALAARHFGIGTRDVTLLPIGGLARLDRMPRDPGHEMWIALAGPAVNLAIATILAIWVVLFGGSFFAQLLTINLALVAFNMLPAFPMDGGRVLRALLARRIGQRRATEIAATIGKAMAFVIGVGGLLFNPTLVFIAVFVWFGAQQEAEIVRQPYPPGWSDSGPERNGHPGAGRPRYVWVVTDRP